MYQDTKFRFGGTLVAFATLGILVYAAIYGIFRGVDFTDEAFYLALPYRFFLGDKPFVDELSLHQTFSLLTFPLMKVFFLLNQSTEGIFLYARASYLFFSFLVSGAIFCILRNYLEWRPALLISSMLIAFVPFNLRALNYNSIGAGLFTLGLFWGMHAALSGKSRYWIFSGLTHGLATFAYPSLIVPLTFFGLFCCSFFNSSPKNGIRYLLSVILPPLFIFLIYRVSPNDLYRSLQFFKAMGEESGHHWSFHKLLGVVDIFQTVTPHIKLILLSSIILLIGRKRKQSALSYAAIMGLVSISIYSSRSSGFGGHAILLSLALVGAIFFFPLKSTPLRNRIFTMIWLPSLCMSIIMGWSSNVSGAPYGTGAIGAALATGVLLTILWGSEFSASKYYSKFPLLKELVLIPLAMLNLSLMYHSRSTFMEDPWKDLHTRIKAGPFKGLYTTETKSHFIQSLSSAISEYSVTGDRILYYPHCPACYLLGSLPPSTPNVWGTCPGAAMNFCTDFLNNHSPSKLLVAHIKILPRWSHGELNYPDDSGSSLATLAKQNHRMVKSTSEFVFYRSDIP